MNFKKWLRLDELSTGTGDIAGFSMRWSPGGSGVIMSKLWPPLLTFRPLDSEKDDKDDHPHKKKKHKRKKKDKDD